MKKLIIPILLLILSSCSLKLNKTSVKEYFSHIHKSGKYEVKEIIGNKAVLRYYKDTILLWSVGRVKKDDIINVRVIK